MSSWTFQLIQGAWNFIFSFHFIPLYLFSTFCQSIMDASPGLETETPFRSQILFIRRLARRTNTHFSWVGNGLVKSPTSLLLSSLFLYLVISAAATLSICGAVFPSSTFFAPARRSAGAEGRGTRRCLRKQHRLSLEPVRCREYFRAYQRLLCWRPAPGKG